MRGRCIAPFVLLMTACGAPPPATVEESAQSVALVRQLIDAVWVEYNVDAMAELLAPDYRYHFNDFSGPGEGLRAAQQGIRRDYQTYSDIRVRIVRLFATDEWATLQWVWSAIDKTTGRPIEIPTTTVYRIANGRIAEAWDSYDYTGVALQLGYQLMPANQSRSP